MAPRERFEKIAQALIAQLADQLMKVLQKGSLVDMYYSFQRQLVEAQLAAYEQGLKEGKDSIIKKVLEFDESKDDVSN